MPPTNSKHLTDSNIPFYFSSQGITKTIRSSLPGEKYAWFCSMNNFVPTCRYNRSGFDLHYANCQEYWLLSISWKNCSLHCSINAITSWVCIFHRGPGSVQMDIPGIISREILVFLVSMHSIAFNHKFWNLILHSHDDYLVLEFYLYLCWFYNFTTIRESGVIPDTR